MGRLSLGVVFAAFLIFFVVTLAVPNVLLFVLLFTFGLGFPLLFLNTVFLYFVAALPMFAALRKQPRSWPAIALAACLIPAVAIIPPLLSRAVATLKMQLYRAYDVSTAFAETPKTVEIAGQQRYYTGPNTDLKSAPCDTLCQRLLLSRAVDLVRVSRSPAVGPIPQAQLDYPIELRPSCPNAFGDGDTVLPETKDAVASGICFIARPIDATPIKARIVVQKNTTPPPQNLAEDFATITGALEEFKRVEILTPSGAGWTAKFQKTEINFLYFRMPTMLVFADCHGMCVGYPILARSKDTLNAFDLDQTVLNALSIKAREPQKPLDPAARVLAMLDHLGDVPTDNQTQIIRDWASCRFGSCAVTPDQDKEVLSRLIRDRRITDFVFVGDVLSRNREFVAANIDLLLDETEARGANTQFANVIGAAIANLDKGLIRAKADKILKLASGNEWKWSRGIGIISGQLGLDTKSLISQRLRQPLSAQNAALAACMADESLGRELVPDLLAYLNALSVSNDFPPGASRDVVKSLARFGHFEEAKQLFLARYPKFGNHSLPSQSAAKVVTDVKACFWG